jgi:hypothetical protein
MLTFRTATVIQTVNFAALSARYGSFENKPMKSGCKPTCREGRERAGREVTEEALSDQCPAEGFGAKIHINTR